MSHREVNLGRPYRGNRKVNKSEGAIFRIYLYKQKLGLNWQYVQVRKFFQKSEGQHTVEIDQPENLPEYFRGQLQRSKREEILG